MQKGDYVLATKYADGDPGDQYAVGFFDSMLPKMGGDRYMVVDNGGKQFRGNGFRRCEPITDAEGRWMIERFPHFKFFETKQDEHGEDVVVGWSVWDWLDQCRAAATVSESR